MKKYILLLLTFSIPFLGSSQVLKQQIPDKTVVLTFDDAPASHYSIVAPLLKKYGFNATFFVCEFPPNYADSTLYMNWRQIRELDKMGFEVANHTHTHKHVSKLSEGEFIAQLEYIEQKCESLGIDKPVNFAYPAYFVSLPALETLEKKGYQFARIGGDRVYNPQKDHPFLIPSWSMTSKNKKEITAAFKKAKDGQIVVLTIHGVPDIEHPWVDTLPEIFEEHLKYLSDNQYKVISIKELDDYIDHEKTKEMVVPKLEK